MIKLDEVDLERHAGGLLAFAIEQLGNAATDTDGFKELHAEAVAAVPAVQEHLRAATDELSSAAETQKLFDAHSLDEDAIAFGAALPEGAAVVNDFALLVAPVEPPPPGPAVKKALKFDSNFINFGRVKLEQHSETIVVKATNVSDKPVTVKFLHLG